MNSVVGNGGMNTSQIATPATIAAFIAGHGKEPICVAILPEDIQKNLGALGDSVLLSRYTADKQQKHPEIAVESYVWLQELLDGGERLYDKTHHATVILHRGKPYIAVLKVTNDMKEVYLQSFRRTDEKNIKLLRNRMESAGGG